MGAAQQTAAQAAAAAEEAKRQAIAIANGRFLAYGRRKEVVCPPSAGGGVNQNYVAGQTLIYDVPTAMGGWLEEFVIIVNLTLTLAAGTAALYAANAGVPFTVFDNLEVVYGQTQSKIKPFFLKTLFQLFGHQWPAPGVIIAGNSNATIQNAIYSTFPVAVGANTWNFYFHFPLRWLPTRLAGMLPIQGDSTKAQIKLQCASTLLGPDPILNTIAATTGTGQAVTVTAPSTVQVLAVYRDGDNYLSPAMFQPNLAGEPTIQCLYDRVLNPLSAGTMNRARFDQKYRHWMALSAIVDGQQSTKFATWANLNGIEFDKDFAGNNKFWAYGATGSNVIMPVLEEKLRLQLGQDIDEGIIPWVTGLIDDVPNPSNRNGQCVLDMTSGHWGDASIGVWPTAVGAVAGVTPRVETMVISERPALVKL